jgi:16S rRNA (cytosine967-C5)-methyltransferase
LERQAGILELAAALVAPGGRLIYSTCSIEPDENEQQVAEFVAANPGWHVELAKLTLPSWGPRLSDWHDGGYVARLRNTAEAD